MKRAAAFCVVVFALTLCQSAFAGIPCWPQKKSASADSESPKECRLAPLPAPPAAHSQSPHTGGTTACVASLARFNRVDSIHDLQVVPLMNSAGPFAAAFSEFLDRSNSCQIARSVVLRC